MQLRIISKAQWVAWDTVGMLLSARQQLWESLETESLHCKGICNEYVRRQSWPATECQWSFLLCHIIELDVCWRADEGQVGYWTATIVKLQVAGLIDLFAQESQTVVHECCWHAAVDKPSNTLWISGARLLRPVFYIPAQASTMSKANHPVRRLAGV